MTTNYSKEPLSITLNTSWTDTSTEYDHVAAVEIFCRSMVMSDTDAWIESSKPRLREKLIAQIEREVGLIHEKDYVFDQKTEWVTTTDIRPGQTCLVKFRGAETYTLFKLKYYG